MSESEIGIGEERTGTGIPGLDDILAGGLPRKKLFLLRGEPGTGKTTLALQFLLEGVRRGENCLYITLSETKEELETVAHSHGWSLDGLRLIEFANVEEHSRAGSHTTLLHPSEVALSRTVRLIEAEVERQTTHRVVLDSLSELRLVAQNTLRYRRQILSLKTYFAARGCTVLFLEDGSVSANDQQVESLSHGVIELQHLRPEYGSERRRLSVLKMRGVRFRGGYHDYVIRRGGLEVFPRLVAAEHRTEFAGERVSSDVPELDALLGGGLDRGTSSLFFGPAGSGKSTLALQFAAAAARREETVAFFLFDENERTLTARAASLNIDVRTHLETNRLRLRQVDPGALAPGEFTAHVRRQVEQDGAKVVVIDSLNGYLNAMPDERFLLVQLHELSTYLAQRGVTTIMILAQHGILGPGMQTPVDLTYLADTVVMLRYFEFEGAIKKAVSVIKKRGGSHEETIRELALREGSGIRVGPPLSRFRGVLTGVPTYDGRTDTILTRSDDRHA